MDFYLRLFTFILLIHFVIGHIIVYRSNQTIEEFYDLPAQFGPSLPLNGLKVLAVASYPRDGCKQLKPPPMTSEKVKYYAVVIARTNCTFEEKVRNAQAAGYNAAIVYNIGSDDLEQMSAKNATNITIPSVFVGETTGNYIIEGYDFTSGFSLLINDELPFNINTHLILPFSILVGLCFIIMIVYMIYKCAREQRRLRQHRLPKRLLKKIPTVKFTKGLPYETCVICLDEYAEGDKLRVLPCQHAYHCACIDTWLTKNRRVCPICKRKVFPKGESSRRARRRPASSDSTTDSETDDTTPLLNPVENNPNNHGTFNNSNNGRQISNEENVVNNATQQRSNPFDRLPNTTTDNIEHNFWNATRIFVSSLFRFTRRNTSSTPHEEITHGIENPINAVLESSSFRSLAVNLPSRLSSNNVLNTNLSGSFQNNDNNEDDDDEPIERRTIYEPIDTTAINIPTNANANASSVHIADGCNGGNGTNLREREDNTTDSIFIQTPSRGGIGVAALPNTSINNDNSNSNNETITNDRRRRGNHKGGGGGNNSLFIV